MSKFDAEKKISDCSVDFFFQRSAENIFLFCRPFFVGTLEIIFSH